MHHDELSQGRRAQLRGHIALDLCAAESPVWRPVDLRHRPLRVVRRGLAEAQPGQQDPVPVCHFQHPSRLFQLHRHFGIAI